MKRVKPVDNEIYHIFNRGVEKRQIFMEEKDYFRFVHDLWEFNDWAPAPNIFYRRAALSSYDIGNRKGYARVAKTKEDRIVEVLAFCLMPNHFHLMLRQLTENGVSEFMRKVGIGYTNFFNQKYKRSGYLFQGKYKIAHIKKHAHFIYLPYYIHLNVLDLKFPEWREKKIKNFNEAIKFLESYRWSSHLDYLGKENFPSVVNKEFLLKTFGSEAKYKKEIEKWLKELDREALATFDIR